eukprot:TRINITY_DN47170_c0_g1_i1.p1 TRINITY_DN47170_c0_g1~~TRINITY_DN47170_c0_g1_i1.p1  ORF type:complete len:253 (+),score=23.86 TRINITY_DN47170_c0_g1_i1:37-795(+)
MPRAIVEVTAGAAGGAAGIVVGQPFDVVKTRAQITGTGSWSHLIGILKGEGVAALWRGVVPPLLGTAVYQGVCFMSYKVGLAMVEGWGTGESGKAMAAGVFSGCVCTLVVTPVDAFKIALQTQTGRLQLGGIRAAARSIRPYHGLSATLLRDVPSTAIYFTTFENLTPHFSTFTAGGLAGMASWASCLPLDTIKTHIQATNSTLTTTIRHIYSTRGILGFAQGGMPLILRAYPVNGVTFLVYKDVEARLSKI